MYGLKGTYNTVYIYLTYLRRSDWLVLEAIFVLCDISIKSIINLYYIYTIPGHINHKVNISNGYSNIRIKVNNTLSDKNINVSVDIEDNLDEYLVLKAAVNTSAKSPYNSEKQDQKTLLDSVSNRSLWKCVVLVQHRLWRYSAI